MASRLSAVFVAIVLLGFSGTVPAAASSLSVLSRHCPELSRGSIGPCVSALQTELDQVGVHPHLRVDGSFGLLTLESVENFQRSKRLPIDGVVGPQTARDLDNALRKISSSKQAGVKMNSLGQHVPLAALLIAGFLTALIIVFRFARHAFKHRDVKSVRVRIRGFAEVEVVKHTSERELHAQLGTAYLNAYAQSQQPLPLPLPNEFTRAIEGGDYYEQP